ncbi:MAG: HAD family phosphatase [Spirochaetaceae bacterium]|nr:HAD family phosphatase [Spirochaetaceae bacterium]
MEKLKLPSCKINAKIIALDLDDTLLKDDLSISDYTVNVLQKAVQAGIYIVLCSGRTENAILPYVRRLDLAGNEFGRYIIASNGSSIFDLHTRRGIFSRTVDSDVLIEAYKIALQYNLFCEVYDASTIFVPEDNEWTRMDVNLSGLDMEVVADYENFLKKGHPKMVIPGQPEQLVEFQKILLEKLGSRCVMFTSKPYFLEILPLNCGKGEALEWLSDRLDIAKDNTMAFGDSMNDESMIRFANHSTAMVNGLDAIKNQAKYVTEYSNEEDGLAKFIEKFVL